uniref:Uncharacterized protein n=1 Tax=Meloidogyne hapla TaxID=6305 RepID=A0A1I8BUY6_MELHA
MNQKDAIKYVEIPKFLKTCGGVSFFLEKIDAREKFGKNSQLYNALQQLQIILEKSRCCKWTLPDPSWREDFITNCHEVFALKEEEPYKTFFNGGYLIHDKEEIYIINYFKNKRVDDEENYYMNVIQNEDLKESLLGKGKNKIK